MEETKKFYIPFLSFYKDRVIFPYFDYANKNHSYTITHLIVGSYMSTDLDEAKKVFRKTLERVAPKNIWDYWGFIKVDEQNYDNLRNSFKNDEKLCEYILYPELKSNQFIEIIDGE